MTGSAAFLQRTVFWQPVDGAGLEHLRLRAADAGYVATGLDMGLDRGTPYRLHYKIKCDDAWNTRKVILESHTPAGEAVRTLRSNGGGRWRDDRGAELPALAGCRDVDISATPFANTLAIRRTNLRPGQGEGPAKPLLIHR